MHSGGRPILTCFRDSMTVFYMLFAVVFNSPAGSAVVAKVWEWITRWGGWIAVLYILQIVFKDVFSQIGVLPSHSYGVLQNPNNIVPLFALLIFLISMEHLMVDRSMTKSAMVAALALLSILLTPCRGATLGCLCAVGVYVLLRNPQAVLSLMMRILPLFCAIAAAGIFVYTLLPVPDHESLLRIEDVPAKFVALISADGGGYKSSTGTFRINWWIAIIAENNKTDYTLLLGQGWGTHLGELVGLFEGTHVRAAHSAWVNVFGWIGLCGFTAYLLVFVKLFYDLALSARVSMHDSSRLQITSILLVTASWLVGVLVSASFDNVMSNPAVCIPLYCIVGGAIYQARTVMKYGSALSQVAR